MINISCFVLMQFLFVGLCVAQDFTQGVLIDRQNVSRLRNLSPEIATNMLQDATVTVKKDVVFI